MVVKGNAGFYLASYDSGGAYSYRNLGLQMHFSEYNVMYTGVKC